MTVCGSPVVCHEKHPGEPRILPAVEMQGRTGRNWPGDSSVVKFSVALSQVSRRASGEKTRVEKGIPRGIHVRTTCTQNDAEPAENGVSDEGGVAPERAQAARSLAGGESLSADSRRPAGQTAFCIA